MEPSIASGVEIDICTAHGTWLDAGEAELIRKLWLFERAAATAAVAVAKERRQAAIATEADAFAQKVRAPADPSKGVAWAQWSTRTLKDDIGDLAKLYRSLRALFREDD